METEHIRMYLAFNYSDEQLAALLAHAESGKLSMWSCCCLVGGANAPHPLQAANPAGECISVIPGYRHLYEARRLPFADDAEMEFMCLGPSDQLRCESVQPIIREEMERREKARASIAEPALVGGSNG